LDRKFVNLPNIREAQIRQEKIGEKLFLVRPGKRYKKEDEGHLRAQITKTIYDDSHIEIEYVDDIERTARGKLRFVVSSILAEDVVGYGVLPPPSLSALAGGGIDR
jgi:hypothetical protein